MLTIQIYTDIMKSQTKKKTKNRGKEGTDHRKRKLVPLK